MNREKIRNFVIFAHIDHGKSTLADRFLEITKTVDSRKMKPQYLDMMAIERERGITIKMQPVRMDYNGYVLNLIDTPGHVDFFYEVSRSLAAVEGAILLVDATQGVQAQTLTNLEMAKKEKLVIVPAINKIDLPTAQVEKTKEEIENLLGIDRKEIILISAKTGQNVETLLEEVIKKVPPPPESKNEFLRAIIFDSKYDAYKGVVAYVRVFDGYVKNADNILLMQSNAKTEVLELGFFRPDLVAAKELFQGEIGYIATGLKEIEKCRVGDTITEFSAKGGSASGGKIDPLRGYMEPQPVVFASFYPVNSDDYDILKDGLGKLKLNDASLSFTPESSGTLGRGFRCGFLGMLHLEIISERLRRDYNLDLVITSPSVVYKKEGDKTEEPWIEMEIISPSQYVGQINNLLSGFPGAFKDTKWLTEEKVLIVYDGPLDIILRGFYDKLKNVSSGYASMAYKLIGYKEGDLVWLDILINHEKIEAFSKMVRRSDAYKEGKRTVDILKDALPNYLIAVPIQASVEGNIIARETKKAMRKDVTGYLYGGDVTRKRKLLEKQKKGKKKMAQIGKISIPSDVFLKILKER